jgi:hypothetical protein
MHVLLTEASFGDADCGVRDQVPVALVSPEPDIRAASRHLGASG